VVKVLKRLKSDKRGDAYIFLVVLMALVFFAIIWFVFFSSDGWVTRVIAATEDLHEEVGSDQHASYTAMTGFISNFMNYFLVITLIILVIAGLVYVQRKRAEAYGY